MKVLILSRWATFDGTLEADMVILEASSVEEAFSRREKHKDRKWTETSAFSADDLCEMSRLSEAAEIFLSFARKE